MTVAGETLKLPGLLESVLASGQIEDLFRDIGTLTRVRDIIPKRGPREHADPSSPSLTLASAREQFLSGALSGLQIRYDYDGAQWWDTLLPAPGGYRIVRIRHDSPDS